MYADDSTRILIFLSGLNIWPTRRGVFLRPSPWPKKAISYGSNIGKFSFLFQGFSCMLDFDDTFFGLCNDTAKKKNFKVATNNFLTKIKLKYKHFCKTTYSKQHFEAFISHLYCLHFVPEDKMNCK